MRILTHGGQLPVESSKFPRERAADRRERHEAHRRRCLDRAVLGKQEVERELKGLSFSSALDIPNLSRMTLT